MLLYVHTLFLHYSNTYIKAQTKAFRNGRVQAEAQSPALFQLLFPSLRKLMRIVSKMLNQ